MQSVTLKRFYNDEKVTIGYFKVKGIDHLFYTCELPWKNNKKNISCIPSGTYKVEKFTSPKHGLCYLIKDVPDRGMIEIHVANAPSQLEGCIAVGLSSKQVYIDKKYQKGVSESRLALNELLNKINKFKLTII